MLHASTVELMAIYQITVLNQGNQEVEVYKEAEVDLQVEVEVLELQ